MVGVAGKSRACHDCKRRRVKCDYQRPTCTRCEKASIRCQGYERITIFVNRTRSEPFTTATLAISEARLNIRRMASEPSIDLQESFRFLKVDLTNVDQSPMVYRSRAWVLLKKLYLPHTQSDVEVLTSTTTSYSWLSAICQLKYNNKALDHALLAFCAVQIHLLEPSSVSLDAVLRLYSETLSELVQILKSTEENSELETLAAIVVLTTCELFVHSDDHAWHAHARGISELLRHRIAFDSRSIMWVKLCSRLRTICVILGLTKHERLSLDPVLWRQYLPTNSTAESFDRLMDMVSEAPLLLERSDKVFSQGGAHDDLIGDIRDLIDQIVGWQHTYKSSSTGLLYWTIPSRAHNVADDGFLEKLFPFCLEFRDLNVAIQLVFSTAVLLQLLCTFIQLKVAYSGHGEYEIEAISEANIGRSIHKYPGAGTISPSTLSAQCEAERLAQFLCQSVEYCFRYEMGTLGPQSFCHPTMVLKEFFTQTGLKRELQWCNNIGNMKGPNFRSGIQMMRFLSQETFRYATHNDEEKTESLAMR